MRELIASPDFVRMVFWTLALLLALAWATFEAREHK